MLSYEIIENISKKTGQPYMIIRMKFLLKGGVVHVIDKFATKDEQTILKMVASNEEILQYTANQEAF